MRSTRRLPRRRDRRGFTLIELLIVIVIIGIMAMIALPKFRETRGKAFASTMRSDLKNIASLQEEYYYDNETYEANLGALGFAGTNGVVLTVVQADPAGWSATATHPAASPLLCSVFYGAAAPIPPATVEGQIFCQ
jgi:prepilin-type N-terminal cleavage/methylation domain-containing protein